MSGRGESARCWLFVPGSRPDRFERALAAGADRVIVDLEDAVSPADKEAARAGVAAWLSPERPVIVRVNGSDSSWFAGDLAAVCRPGLAGIMLPKAEDTATIRLVARHIAPIEGAVIVPIIETARGLWHARRLAGAAPQVERLAFGALDLALDLGLAPAGLAPADDDLLTPARQQLVLVSRVADIAPPLDGVTTQIDDPQRLRAAAIAARRLGFGGKLAIHPRQVAVVQAAFTPTPEEIDRARRIVAAAASTSAGAVRLDGEMVDRPVVEWARRLLHEAAPL